jgi:hypothetical protein
MAAHHEVLSFGLALGLLLFVDQFSANAQNCPRDPEGDFVMCDEGKNIASRFNNEECSQIVLTLREALTACGCYLGSNEARGAGESRARQARNVVSTYLRHRACQIQ